MPLSTAPVWLGQKLESRPLVLRMYVAAAGDSYAVMPGGLTRIAASGDVPIVSMQRGGGSKDTWVLADGPVSPMSLLAPPTIRIQRERGSGDLPSRVADNLFWLGRYAERVEHSVRLLRSVVARLADEDCQRGHAGAHRAGTRHSSRSNCCRRAFAHPHAGPRPRAASCCRRCSGRTRARACAKRLEELRRIASNVRDRLSIDTWRILNQLRQDFRLRHGRIQLDDALLHLNRMITDLAAFSGMEMENMTRGTAGVSSTSARRLERAANMTTLLRAVLASGSLHHAMLGPLLEIADSTMTYRRRYFAQPQLTPVLDLLVADPTNARSLAFQVVQLADHVDQLPRDTRAPSPTKEQRIVAQMSEVDCQRRSRRDGTARGGRIVPAARRRCFTRSPTTSADCRTPSPTTTSAMRRSVSADVRPVTYDVVHVTRYAYTESVSVSHHLARLSPRTARSPGAPATTHRSSSRPRPCCPRIPITSATTRPSLRCRAHTAV